MRIVTTLRKPEAVKVAIDTDYASFNISNELVVGHGFDYAERYRRLPFVGTFAPYVYGSQYDRRETQRRRVRARVFTPESEGNHTEDIDRGRIYGGAGGRIGRRRARPCRVIDRWKRENRRGRAATAQRGGLMP